MNEGKRILIIEDDPEISKLLHVILTKMGMEPVLAYSGTEGMLQLKSNTFDLILLDLMLPGISGEELLTQVREESPIPIIVISAKVGIDDKVQVLKLGADDYITKPFHQKEVEARVEVQLRKSVEQPSEEGGKVWRELIIFPEKLSVTLESRPLQVTNAEFDILSLLIHHPEHAFSKREIYEKIWKGTYVGDDNTISVHISNLRRKMAEVTDEEYIRTIWGVGFMLV